MIAQNKRLFAIFITVTILLLVPFVAMRFTSQVNWNIFDFVIGGMLLLGTGLFVELVIKEVKKPVHRLLIIEAILLTLFLVWAELAVGIFGTPFAGS